MRLCVLFDRSGQILAGLPMDQPLLLGKYMSTPRPVPQAGQQVAEMDVPEEFRHRTLLDICTKLKVDTKSDPPTLVVVEQPSRTAG
jgi:hypothetical protein